MRNGVNIIHTDIPQFMYRGYQFSVEERRFPSLCEFERYLENNCGDGNTVTCILYNITTQKGDPHHFYIRYKLMRPIEMMYLDLIDEVKSAYLGVQFEVNSTQVRNNLIGSIYNAIGDKFNVPFALVDMTTDEMVNNGDVLIMMVEGKEDPIEVLEYLERKLRHPYS